MPLSADFGGEVARGHRLVSPEDPPGSLQAAGQAADRSPLGQRGQEHRETYHQLKTGMQSIAAGGATPMEAKGVCQTRGTPFQELQPAVGGPPSGSCGTRCWRRPAEGNGLRLFARCSRMSGALKLFCCSCGVRVLGSWHRQRIGRGTEWGRGAVGRVIFCRFIRSVFLGPRLVLTFLCGLGGRNRN